MKNHVLINHLSLEQKQMNLDIESFVLFMCAVCWLMLDPYFSFFLSVTFEGDMTMYKTTCSLMKRIFFDFGCHGCAVPHVTETGIDI